VAQKSLPILNKVNTSMIWYSTYYCKHYKWMSSQNLYLLYFFNKLFVYLDFFFFHLLWVRPYTSHLYYTPINPSFALYEKFRFFKPITSYLVTLNTRSIFFNLYYKTSLETFQALNRKADHYSEDFFEEMFETTKLSKIFYA